MVPACMGCVQTTPEMKASFFSRSCPKDDVEYAMFNKGSIVCSHT